MIAGEKTAFVEVGRQSRAEQSHGLKAVDRSRRKQVDLVTAR
jgi:hypothetical protein